MTMTTKEKIESILRHVAESEKIKKYEVTSDVNVLRGDGILSEFYTGDVKDKDTGKLIQTYIKLPPHYGEEFRKDVYFNEFHFYSKIYPELKRFQEEKGVKEPFDKIPKFYCGSVEPKGEYIVLENLKVQAYETCDKAKFLDQNHLEYLFKIYGKYHALTFAFKDQSKDKHQNLAEPLKDIFKIAYKRINETDEKNALKVKALIDNINETCLRGVIYEGQYSAFVHGDCWSNNIMFKYNAENGIENLKLIDHQIVRNSTPVHDLSYFFYSGASKKDFDKLEDYLKLYYDSFSSFARELGSVPEELLPFQALISDWKKYSFLGVLMALVVWQFKLVKKEEIEESMGEKGDMKGFLERRVKEVYATDTFKTNISNILLHAAEYGVI